MKQDKRTEIVVGRRGGKSVLLVCLDKDFLKGSHLRTDLNKREDNGKIWEKSSRVKVVGWS